MSQGDWIDVPDDFMPPQSQMDFGSMYAPAVIQVESGGDPYAVNKVSGAKGLGQFRDPTGREVSQRLGYSEYNPFDADQSKAMTKAYLNQLYDQFQSPELAFAAYNYGMGNVEEAIQKAKSRDFNAILPHLPKETQDYVPKVLGNFNQNRQPTEQQRQFAQNYGQFGSQDQQAEAERFVINEMRTNGLTENQAKDKFALLLQGQAGFNNSDDEWVDVPDEQWVDAPIETAPAVEPKRDWVDTINALSGNALQGLTFNFGDELGLVDKDLTEDFAQDNPKTAIAAQIAGGMALPVGGAKALTKAPSLVSALLGAGPKGAAASGIGRVAQGAGYGAAYGGLSGAGDGENATERILKAGEGALVGGAGGVAISGLANALIRNPTSLSKSEKLLAKRLKDVPEDSLQATQTALKESTQPLFLPEALQTEDLFRQAKTIANSPDTKDIAQALIKARKEAQPDRLNAVLDEVAALKNPAEAGSAIKSKATDVLDAMNAEKNLIAKKTYGPVYKATPAVSDDLLADLLRSPNAQSAAKSLRKSREYMDYPENSTEFLHAVKSALSTKAQAAADGTERRLLSGDADYLRQALNENVSGLADADQVYTKLMEKIGDVSEDSLLGLATKKGDLNISELGSKILSSKTDPKQVQKLIKDLGEDGEELVLGAVRAKLSDDIANRVSGNGTANLFDKVAVKERLTDIMGAEKASKVLKKLEDEVTIAKGTNRYKFGSDSYPNAKDADLEDKVRDFAKYYGRKPTQFIGDGLSFALKKFYAPSRESLQDEARLIFSNEDSSNALAKILMSSQGEKQRQEMYNKILPLLTSGEKAIPTIEIKNTY